jgi:hypothetical protein
VDRDGTAAEDVARLAEPAGGEPIKAQAVRSPLIRLGYCALGGSVIVTFIGTVLLAQGRTTYESTASFVRHCGLLLMLISCAVVLIGYRLPHLRRLYNSMCDPSDSVVPVRRPARATPAHQSQFSLRGLFVLMTLSAIMLALLFTTPDAIFVFIAAYAHLALISMLIVVIVYDRGPPQAFCIASITPAVLSIFMSTMFFGVRIGFSRPLGFRLLFATNWVMIIIIGLAGVGVRFWLAGNTRCDDPVRSPGESQTVRS